MRFCKIIVSVFPLISDSVTSMVVYGWLHERLRPGLVFRRSSGKAVVNGASIYEYMMEFLFKEPG